MTSTLARDASFVVRIWWEHPDRGTSVLRGFVQHVNSGDSISFDSFLSLESFIHKCTELPLDGNQSPTPETAT